MNRVMQWIDHELARDPKLAEQVDAELARLRLEQDLVALREARGMSQRALARKIGVSQPVIARIESGRARNLEVRTLIKIAAALDSEVQITIRRRRTRRSPRSRRTPATAARP
jgi:transcriptional regulator with XRE-family HTH domain